MDDDLLKEFVNECREHLATIETDLLSLEEGGADIDETLVNKVFRAAHSIKGGSGFFGLNRIKELAHKAETVLDMLRSRKMEPNSEVTNILLAAFDTLREMVNDVAQSEQVDIEALAEGLTALAASYLPPDRRPALRATVDFPAPTPTGKVTLPQTDVERATATGMFIYWLDCDLIHDIERKGQDVLELFRTMDHVGELLDCSIDFESLGTLESEPCNRLPLSLVLATVLEPDIVGGVFETIDPARIHLLRDPHTDQETPAIGGPAPAAITPPPPATPTPPPRQTQAPAMAPVSRAQTNPVAAAPVDESIRINVAMLDALMNLAGELVLSRNQLRAAVAQEDRQLLASADQRINQVTSELQDAIMQTRLQPIGNVFAKFPRVVRDLSHALGKEINLEITGKDVALDKTLIEGLSDPLTHMLRNAVDHGVEPVDARVRAGKNPVGRVRIDARHEAGQVVVEIADDGQGLDPERISEAAIRKGLIAAEKVQAMADWEKQSLIFLPSLSTAQVVSDVSGRGVGMDVVKTNLDRLGGKVEISSTVGKGSTFRIKLPLTLAIIPSLIISLENERFAIPQANVEELIRLRAEDVQRRIEVVGDVEMLLLRNRMLPLARMGDLIGLSTTYSDPESSRAARDRRNRLADRRSPRHDRGDAGGAESEAASAETERRERPGRRNAPASAMENAILNTGSLTFGLVVGTFHTTEEVVVKPLGRRFEHLREYSGATILGDGTVALIVDVAGVAAKADLSSASGTPRAAELAAQAEAERLQDAHAFLLFQHGPEESCVVPLDIVQRIERIRPQQIEWLGNNRTMQYRGGSLPLVSLSDIAALTKVDDMRELVVFVSSVHDREVGLLGAPPIDVVEVRTAIDQHTHRQDGVAGSLIIHGRTTYLVELHELVNRCHPEWQQSIRQRRAPVMETISGGGAAAILLAEDSDFFRGQVKRYLEEEGFAVHDAPDGEAAWDLLLKHLDSIRVVVTDIEMPRLTGLGLATRIRGDDRTADLPIIAVTSLAGEEDAARGLAAGVTEYQVKLDREALVSRIHSMLATA
jgi:two-component system chemotaxis sensor kinase CheA